MARTETIKKTYRRIANSNRAEQPLTGNTAIDARAPLPHCADSLNERWRSLHKAFLPCPTPGQAIKMRKLLLLSQGKRSKCAEMFPNARGANQNDRKAKKIVGHHIIKEILLLQCPLNPSKNYDRFPGGRAADQKIIIPSPRAGEPIKKMVNCQFEEFTFYTLMINQLN